MLDALAAVTRSLLYAGLLSCAGIAFASFTLRIALPDISDAANRILRFSGLLTLATSVASALLLILRLGGEFDEATIAAVLNSGFGAALGAQLAGSILVLASVGDTTALGMRLGGALLLALSFAFSGHAGAMGPTDGLVVFVHIGSAAWWIGSLWLLRTVCQQSHFAAVAQAVRGFGSQAAILIGALVLAGLVLMLTLVNFDQLPSLSPYERLLAVKIAIVATVLGIASYNRFRLTPRLNAGDASAATTLQRMIVIELWLIGAVLATTAILTTYTAPEE